MVNDLSDRMTWEEIVEKVKSDCNIPSDKFGEWLKLKGNLTGGRLLFNSLLYGRLWAIMNSVTKDDRDHFIVVAGKEGTGKTTLAIQMGAVLSERFNLNSICFKPYNFIDNIDTSQKGDCIQLDEGNLFLFSREAMSGTNVDMVKIFALMRQRNLIVIICVPNFFTLDTYIRDHRVDTLINIEERGKFTCYFGKAIKIISKEGAKYKTIKGIKVPYGTFFDGYYNKLFPTQNDITFETYSQHKHNQFKDFITELKNNYTDIKENLLDMGQATKISPLSSKTIKRMIQNEEVEGKKIGKKWFITKEAIEKLTIP